MRDTAVVTIEVEEETVPKLSDGTTLDGLECPLNPIFKVQVKLYLEGEYLGQASRRVCQRQLGFLVPTWLGIFTRSTQC